MGINLNLRRKFAVQILDLRRKRGAQMAEWIWERAGWPSFCWDTEVLIQPLGAVHMKLGELRGLLSALGMRVGLDTALSAMAADVIGSSEIEGVVLDAAQVRSSVAVRLGLATEGLPVPSHYIDGLVDVMVDACRHAEAPLSHEILWGYHRKLFPAGGSDVGCYRHSSEPMRVISGMLGRENVHFEAPPSERVPGMMDEFVAWVNSEQESDAIVKAGIAALWFVTIHPFSDGNGRLSRTLTDKLLARADGMSQRYYSMSAAIQRDRMSYYRVLEATQRGNLDITAWLNWFLKCLLGALAHTEHEIQQAVRRAQFWEAHADICFNDRQRRVLLRLMEPFEGKLTTSKYAKLAKCSNDTALRDLKELVSVGILSAEGVGRGTYYIMNNA